MRYGEGLLEEVRRRTDLVALVGRRVKLVRKGRVMWGCCPFHQEKSPSFKVENERRLYKCFGCGKGGDCFRWLVETEGLNFPRSGREAGRRGRRGTAQMVARRRRAGAEEKIALRHRGTGGRNSMKLSCLNLQAVRRATI